MSTTYVAELDPAKIKKMQILVTNCKMSRDEILAKYGSKDVYIMNGGLYGGPYDPNCQLKVDGKILGNDKYNYWGYSWNTALDFAMRRVPLDSAGFANYISCAALLKDGELLKLYGNDAHVDAPNRRTALGRKNGKICMMVTTALYTPSQLQTYCKSLGWSDAIMLDGGGSSQCYFNGKVIYSSDKYLARTKYKERNVQNWIIIYMNDSSTTTTPTTPTTTVDTPTTVYPVPPTRTLKLGSKGTDVSWVQTRLTVHGFTCPVTGDFYTTTETLVKKFQTAKGLEPDGVVGTLTVKALKADPAGTTTPTHNANPYTVPTRTLEYNAEGDDVKWLQQQLTLAGYTCSITGQFGPTTKTLVIKFQTDHNLGPDGVVGPLTLSALKSAVK